MSSPTPSRGRANDHLANERTYLAWIRTAISLMGFGVVIVRLRYFLPPDMRGHGHGWELGVLFALVGLILVPLSARQYFVVRDAIEKDEYRASDSWIIVCSVVIGLIGACVLWFLFSSPDGAVSR